MWQPENSIKSHMVFCNKFSKDIFLIYVKKSEMRHTVCREDKVTMNLHSEMNRVRFFKLLSILRVGFLRVVQKQWWFLWLGFLSRS